MKKRLWIAVLLFLLLPRRGTDVGQLLPVETLLIEKTAGRYQLSTDTGSTAEGESLQAAMDALRAEAPGVIFLETADYVLLTWETVDCMEALSDYVRPGTRVYEINGAVDLAEIGPSLRAHGPDAPLYRLQKREQALPKLWAEGGKLRFEGE